MTEHVDGWLPDLVLGTLDDPTRAMVELHLEQCDRCSAEVVALTDALSDVALSIPPQQPSRTGLTRVLTSIIEEEQRDAPERAPRFGALTERLARFFEVTVERVNALVQLVDEPAAWSRGPAEGIKLVDIDVGGRFAAADVGFVLMAPEATFPHHRHVGGELVLVLEGAFIEDDGTVVRAGELQDLAANTRHSFKALGEGCILAVIIREGLDFAAPCSG